MESLAVVSDLIQPHDDSIALLLADDDAAHRSLLAARVSDAVAALTVHEAADGAEAIQIGLQRRPQIALLDVDMPLLGGIEVALVLRELLPDLRLALHAADPAAEVDIARELCVPLFDKLESDHALRWVERQARSGSARRYPATSQKSRLECSKCGYRIARSAPPERCPMCQAVEAWVHAPWRPLTGRLDAM